MTSNTSAANSVTIHEPAVSLDIAHNRPADQMHLHPVHSWQRPKQELTFLLNPPHGGHLWFKHGNPKLLPWGPTYTTIERRIEKVRKALDDFRKLHTGYLDSISPGELSTDLESFSPSSDWSENPFHLVTAEYRNAWARIVASDELRKVAEEGHWLLNAIFEDGSEWRKSLHKLAPGDRFKVIWQLGTASGWAPHVPWPLLYLSSPPRQGEEVDPGQFLGIKLRLSYARHQGLATPHSAALGKADRINRAHILYWGGQATDEVAKEAMRHADELAVWTPLVAPKGKSEVCDFLHEPHPKPVPILYFYCKARAGDGSNPILRLGSTNSANDQLELGDLGSSVLTDRPLVFINACDTVSADAFYSNELEQRFFERGCSAFIGTECKVPIGVSARFAKTFFFFLYTRYGDLPTPAGEAFSQARRFFWVHYLNLSGLFYSYVNDDMLCVGEADDVASLR